MNTQAEQAPVHSGAAGRMVHVGVGLAEFAQDLSITEKKACLTIIDRILEIFSCRKGW